VFHLKRNPNYYTQPLHAQNDETNGNTEFLQPYPVVEADALLEIGMADQLFCRSISTCHKHFLCPEILLSVGVLLSYSVLPCQDTS
jgi:hypothetical protein